MEFKPPQETFVRTTAELTDLWRALMGPGGFDLRSLWTIFLDMDGGLSPVIVPIDDIPDEPDDLLLRNFTQEITLALSDRCGASAAQLLSRPGSGQVTASDRRWALAAKQTLGQSLCPWPIHLATSDRVQVFAPDDLIAA